VIVDRRADEDDVVFQQPGVNIVRSLAPVGLFNDHRNQCRGTRTAVVCMSHRECVCALRNPNLLFTFGRRLDPGVAVEPVYRFVAAQLRFHPIERPLLCQPSTQRCC